MPTLAHALPVVGVEDPEKMGHSPSPGTPQPSSREKGIPGPHRRHLRPVPGGGGGEDPIWRCLRYALSGQEDLDNQEERKSSRQGNTQQRETESLEVGEQWVAGG